ncbi:MAG: ABC transporter permease [Liquorilactobacillus satsumensis]|uniref:MacB-like periplasmic core domain-containing protein n=2 Tax=Liquorilactobacillus satsumensis TaxID=259059 RepID=A0A0R1UXR4_9LACO|nr:hypothetical protein FD50_GL000966 [Liquorilactobacillus satsumensis DSM 16230 = JCM 12392]
MWLLFYSAVFVFCSVFLFVKLQQRTLMIQLNNHNLTPDAYRVVLKTKMTMQEFTDRLNSDESLSNVQVHFQDKKNKRVTYFYGIKNFPVPPMLTGNFFDDDDFNSAVAVAVVGKNYKKKLYLPKDQSYLKFQGNYLPVVGVMGDSYHTELDNQLFISPSIEMRSKMVANNYRIVIDGKTPLSKKKLTSVLGAAQVSHANRQHLLIEQDSWIVSHWKELIGLIFVGIGLLAIPFLWALLGNRRYRELLLANDDQRRLVYIEWEFFALFSGLGVLFGGLAGMLFFELDSYVGLLSYDIAFYLVNNLIFIRLISKKIKDLK